MKYSNPLPYIIFIVLLRVNSSYVIEIKKKRVKSDCGKYR